MSGPSSGSASFPRLPAEAGGPPPLSPRERQLLELLAAGHTYKTAAHEMGIRLDTVRFHVRNLYARLAVHSKTEAVVKALRSGLLR